MIAFSQASFSSLWDIFLLFAVPIGGGIPAGVLLADHRGVGWAEMGLLYLASDIMLAFLFEPLMKLFSWGCDRSLFLFKLRDSFRQTTNRIVTSFGKSPSPFVLIMIAFGVDPMTGRAAAMSQGHGFITGWTIAITGDMIFFSVVAISTISLNSILGDGTWTAVIIMFCMLGIPAIIRRIRRK